MKPMRRTSWLVAIAAAFFVLQAPLCALACFEALGTDSSEVAERSCHDEGSDSSPASNSNSHDDCGCNFDSQPLVSQPTDSNTTTSSIEIAGSPPSRSERIHTSRVRESETAQYADLPPPDILLLKSTLII